MRTFLILIIAIDLLLMSWIAQSIEPWKEVSVNFDCEFNGKPICCSLLHSHPTHTWHKSPNSAHSESRHHRGSSCKVSRQYKPSAYEDRHRSLVERIDAMREKEEWERYLAIRKIVYEEYDESIEVMKVVKKHMSAPERGNSSDLASAESEYLSRFIVRRSCGGGVNHTWVEYIEPLSFFARDVRGYIAGAELKRDPGIVFSSDGKIPSYLPWPETYVLSREFVLLQDSDALAFSRPHSGSTGRHFLFDAGSSSFDTSLAWMLCGYQQRGISFDKAMAWEMKAVNGTRYWSDVPANLISLLHFYNTPISANYSETHSVLRQIDEVAEEGDFVAFKLDVDRSSVELPIALEILRNPKYHRKIDEFFFELHFHCEVVGPCCWDHDYIPSDINGFTLDRLHAFNFFQELRYAGIRAHFWP
eukprot:gene1720-1825_t